MGKYCSVYNMADVYNPWQVRIDSNTMKKMSVFMEMAVMFSQLSHCVSKKVAAFIVRNGRIISTGINGSPSGATNCDDVFDPNSFDRNIHHFWSELHELHAESNAIAEAAKRGIAIYDSDLYVTLSPCSSCAKLIAASGIKNVYFDELYDKYSVYTRDLSEISKIFNAADIGFYQLRSDE